MSRLSKGMLSMVTIIVALASKAEFTFLDEPAAGLNVVAREKFYRRLMEEYTKTGRTFVISPHIIEEAADIFEEVILMKEGQILLMENTQELLERSYYISGREDEVDYVVSGRKVYQEERLGRSKGVTLMLEQGERISTDYDVDIRHPSLQKLFVALCGNTYVRLNQKTVEDPEVGICSVDVFCVRRICRR